MTQALKCYCRRSFVEAKAEVDLFLSGVPITLQFDSDAMKEEFMVVAEALGINCNQISELPAETADTFSAA